MKKTKFGKASAVLAALAMAFAFALAGCDSPTGNDPGGGGNGDPGAPGLFTQGMVSAGVNYAVAIDNDGRLWAWGGNGAGQLGIGSTGGERTTAVRVGTDSDWLYVSAGSSHALGIRTDGSLWAWGSNTDGRLGDGSTTARNAPVLICDAHEWLQVAGGNTHSMAIRSDNTLWGWGVSGGSSLGNGSGASNVPIRIGREQDTTLSGWTRVAAGDHFTVGIRDGSLYIWGSGLPGQGGTVQWPTRIDIDGTWTHIAAGVGHVLAIREGGARYAWGALTAAGLGRPATAAEPEQPTPAQRPGEAGNWQSIAAGTFHSLGVRGGALYAWGQNLGNSVGSGTTGLGAAANHHTPRQLGTGGWTQVSANGSGGLLDRQFSVGIRNGHLYAWGSNYSGKTGLGATSGFTVTPTRVRF